MIQFEAGHSLKVNALTMKLNLTKIQKKVKFEKLDSYQFKEKPTDKANFLLWTGDINDKPGYWEDGSDTTGISMKDQDWVNI